MNIYINLINELLGYIFLNEYIYNLIYDYSFGRTLDFHLLIHVNNVSYHIVRIRNDTIE